MARCFLALWQGAPVAFCATLPVIGRRRHWRISRIVTLPDYQGIGIGMRVAECVAHIHQALRENDSTVTASHPALTIAHCQRSPLWRSISVKKHGSLGGERIARRLSRWCSPGRAVVFVRVCGPREQLD